LSVEMRVALDQWTRATGAPWKASAGLVAGLRPYSYVVLVARSLSAGRTPRQAKLEAARSLGISVDRYDEPSVERLLRRWRNGRGG